MKVIIESGIGVKEAERRLLAGDRSPELESFMVDGEFINEAEKVLKQGFSASYADLDYPGEFITEHPDGSRHILGIDDDGNEFVVRDIPPVNPPRSWLK